MTEQVDASRESLWDAMRAFATVRVVAWHTWRWAPLSWVAAMPAMFFTAGVLLEGSVERHGWTSTLRTRLRRLLVPFWVYSATSVVIMLALGWRPGFGDVWQWVIPLGDPVGSSEAPSLWIPLWYLRAYLWFVVASGVLSWLVRRLGWWTVGLLAVCAGLQQLLWSSAPLAVSDGVVYAVFVSAGMVVSVLGVPRRAIVVPIAVGATVATAAAMVSGLASTVVNESHVVTAIAGVATVDHRTVERLAHALGDRTRVVEPRRLVARGTDVDRRPGQPLRPVDAPQAGLEGAEAVGTEPGHAHDDPGRVRYARSGWLPCTGIE